MHLIIDGYNLLHVGRSQIRLSSTELQWERDQLIEQLSAYKKQKALEITVVFDGWQGGWRTEKMEKKKGIELIFSKLGEKADEVIKRLVREKGSGVTVVTSDRDVSRYAERIAVPVIPSDQFRKKMEIAPMKIENGYGEEDEEKGLKKKGPSRRLSKRERRARAVLKKL
jgi:hypothetical protein